MASSFTVFPKAYFKKKMTWAIIFNRVTIWNLVSEDKKVLHSAELFIASLVFLMHESRTVSQPGLVFFKRALNMLKLTLQGLLPMMTFALKL